MAINVLAIVQARMGSTRLPGKTLIDIEGKPLLEHVINRIRYSKMIEEIIIATTNEPEDKVIVNMAKKLQVKTYEGSSYDVLDRFYQVARLFKGKVIVRITADDPFKDPKVIDDIVKYFLSHPELNYVSNTIEPSYPVGIDVEVFSYQALKTAWENAKDSAEREHVTPYIIRNPSLFKIANYKSNKQLSYLRWTIDTKEDLQMTKEVYNKLYLKDKIFYMDDILQLLQKYPHISDINSSVKQLVIEPGVK